MKYNPQKIEKKWQKEWEKRGTNKTSEGGNRPKYYILDMFPYTSGSGLHVGHPKGYIATDVLARMKMMQGFNVLHPMGWDAFGLPAENYALKNKIHPSIATEKNIKTFKKQIGFLGFTYDWDREINTIDPKYYKWTQWAFLQMFKKGLVHESYEPINWCPSCKTGLANEDLEEGLCERCGSVVEKKPMRQWVIKITDYAERLLQDLDKLSEWEESIKEMQRNWIGKSAGALVKFHVIPAKAGIQDQKTGFPVKPGMTTLEVFTTRPDTLFGATYVVLAPEHKIILDLKSQISNLVEVKKYIESAKHKSDLERTDLAKEKTGVKLEGVVAVNPVNGEELPVFIADYVMTGYGTGAIMAVPAHDERDWEFAKKFGLPIRRVVQPNVVGPVVTLTQVGQKVDTTKLLTEKQKKIENFEEIYSGVDGRLINSGEFTGMFCVEAKSKITSKFGNFSVQYKIRDWVFSRQRYWGEPIPLVKCAKHGWVSVPDEDLPLELPKVKHYEPTGTGESPLANIKEWVNTKCPKCGGSAVRETNTMPQWAGSCWYYLRFIDPHNQKALVDIKKEKYWSPVDLYVGGAEHATRHLIYARFWHKFLFDIGAVNYDEPFTKLQHVGLILAEDGRKMSKRWNNVINPDEVVKNYGADALRLYEMFMGPFGQPCAWSTQGVVGMRRFLERVWNLLEIFDKKGWSKETDKNLIREIEKTIKKVSDDITELKFNTAISALMILFNQIKDDSVVSKNEFSKTIQLLAPFVPHLAEEVWQILGNKKSIFESAWPKFNPELAKDESIVLVVQVNGKLRETLNVPADIKEEDARLLTLKSEKIQKWLEGKTPKKVIFVPGKLINIVV